MFNKKPDLAKLYREHKEELNRLMFHDVNPTVDYQMEFAFMDSKGRAYDRFIGSDRPLERSSRMQDYMIQMSSGLSGEELEEILAALDNEMAVAFSAKGKFSPVKVGGLIAEIRDRKNLLIHTELIYHFLAVQVVRRHDEPVDTFVPTIHQEKVDQFKADNAQSGSFFFFQVPELKLVNDFLKFTQEEWNQYWQESQRQIDRTKLRLSRLSGAKESSKSESTKEPA